jgi:hypothetical protein
MSLIATENGGSYQLPPEGNHLGRCVQVIDLGTQNDTYNGKPKKLHKVRLGWELPEERAVFNEERGEEPFLVSKEYTLALGERANLRHDLESWRARRFSESELEAFDVSKFLEATCMVNVIHRISAKKRKYAHVNGVTPLPKGIKDVPKQVLPSLKYMIEDGAGGVFPDLPEFIRNKIMASVEWQQAKSALNENNGHEEIEEPKSDDEEIPY